MFEKAPPASARLPCDSRSREEQLSTISKCASRLRWHPRRPQHPRAAMPAHPGLPGAGQVLLAHSATTRSPGTQRLSPTPLHPFNPPPGTPPDPPTAPRKQQCCPCPGQAGKGLRSLRGGGRGWGCSRDQALVSGFAISHSVLMWRVCLNNLTRRLINQALAFVCRLKAEMAIRRNTERSGTALPPAGPLRSLSLSSLLPDSAAPGSLISCLPSKPCPRGAGVRKACASVSPLRP